MLIFLLVFKIIDNIKLISELLLLFLYLVFIQYICRDVVSGCCAMLIMTKNIVTNNRHCVYTCHNHVICYLLHSHSSISHQLLLSLEQPCYTNFFSPFSSDIICLDHVIFVRAVQLYITGCATYLLQSQFPSCKPCI